MTTKRIIVLCLALIALIALESWPAVASLQGRDRFGYHDTIVVARDETRDNVITFGGDIIVEGTVRKSVLAFGGTITVSGVVGESVVGLGAKVMLKSTAVVKGDLVGIGGTIEKEPGFRVDGDTVYFKGSEISGKVLSEGLKGLLTFPFLPIFLILKTINIFIWVLLAFIVVMAFPKQAAFAADQVRTSFWPIFGTGLLALLCYTFLAIFAAVLCLLLIGIPILFGLIIAGLVIKVFGKVAVFVFFGQSLLRKGGGSVLGAAMLGLLIVSLISFIPVLGMLFSLVLSIIGWGISIRTKFGTTENWFRGKTLPAAPPPPAAQ